MNILLLHLVQKFNIEIQVGTDNEKILLSWCQEKPRYNLIISENDEE